jgi:hypothetical protein
MSAELAATVVSIVVAAVGVYLGNSIRRKGRQERETATIAKRFDVYPRLWTATRGAAPMAEVIDPAQDLTQKDLDDLYGELDCWFWEKGGGTYLGEPSRTIYLRAKENLKRRDDDLWPDSARDRVRRVPPERREHVRSALARRQLSLLRTALRADLGIYGRAYRRGLSEDDKDFLRRCGAQLWRRPWWDGTLRGWAGELLRRRPAED